jgi:hypothetical protein
MKPLKNTAHNQLLTVFLFNFYLGERASVPLSEDIGTNLLWIQAGLASQAG